MRLKNPYIYRNVGAGFTIEGRSAFAFEVDFGAVMREENITFEQLYAYLVGEINKRGQDIARIEIRPFKKTYNNDYHTDFDLVRFYIFD